MKGLKTSVLGLVADSEEEAIDFDVEILCIGSALMANEMSAFKIVVAEETESLGVEEHFYLLILHYTCLHVF